MEQQRSDEKNVDAVVIGGSSGSMEILKVIIPCLRKNLRAAVMVVYHNHPDSGNFMARYLDEHSDIAVRQAEDKEILKPGMVYIAPSNYHFLVEPDRSVALSVDEPVHFSRPSIDVLFETASDAYADRIVGVILSGANMDGASGLKYIKDRGGMAVVQSPQSAEMDPMPLAALAAVTADYVLEPTNIGPLLNRITG